MKVFAIVAAMAVLNLGLLIMALLTMAPKASVKQRCLSGQEESTTSVSRSKQSALGSVAGHEDRLFHPPFPFVS